MKYPKDIVDIMFEEAKCKQLEGGPLGVILSNDGEENNE